MWRSRSGRCSRRPRLRGWRSIWGMRRPGALPCGRMRGRLRSRCRMRNVGSGSCIGWRGVLAPAAGAEFALDREPPLRAHLYGLSAREHVLLLVLHHIAGDGWSLGVLLRDVARCYGARRAGETPGLAPLAVQYADYTLWQQEMLGSESAEGSAISRQLLFWREHLEGLPEQIELPSDRARPAVASHRGGSVGLLLDGELHAGLLRLARSGGASLFMVLQAGLVGLLSRLGG